MQPTCPKCGRPMTGGAPHGPWAVQYECRRCNVYVFRNDDRKTAEPGDTRHYRPPGTSDR